MLHVQKLLTDVGLKTVTLREAKKLVSSQLAPDFQVLDFLRNDEMGISACLAHLLDPQGSHGQGVIFLDLFLDQIVGSPTRFIASEKCRVDTEKQANGQRRLDIHLTFPNGVIGIENKPWAGDQKDQLKDYANYLQHQAGDGNWVLLYFSNQDPSVDSICTTSLVNLQSTNNYIQVTFNQITDWLDTCAAKAQALTVRVFIEQLIKFIHAKINGIVDMSEFKEIQNILLKNPENLQAAIDITNTLEQTKEDLLQKFIDDIQDKIQGTGWIFIKIKTINVNAYEYTGFGIKFSENDSKMLCFEFAKRRLNDFTWGIRRSTEEINYEPQVWREINDVMAGEFGQGVQNEWWPWYSCEPNRVLDPGHETAQDLINWQFSEKPWLMLKTGVLVDNIINLAHRVQSILLRSSLDLATYKTDTP